MQIDLSNLANASAQQVFDHVALHLLNQNEKSMMDIITDYNDEPTFACVYRNEYGCRCAAGSLITPEQYSDLAARPFMSTFGRMQDGIENITWNQLVRQGAVPAYHVDLIVLLQSIHDSSGTDEWRADLIQLAKEQNLDPKVVKEFAHG